MKKALSLLLCLVMLLSLGCIALASEEADQPAKTAAAAPAAETTATAKPAAETDKAAAESDEAAAETDEAAAETDEAAAETEEAAAEAETPEAAEQPEDTAEAAPEADGAEAVEEEAVTGSDASAEPAADDTASEEPAADGTASDGTVMIGSTAYATLEEAVTAAKSGDTITLGEGTFSTYGLTAAQGKSLTFTGAGADKTTWVIGEATSDGVYYGEYKCDYSFDGSDTISFNNLTLKSGTNDYLGFARVGNINTTDCVIDGKVCYWGTDSATFTNVTWNAPGSDYCLWDYGNRNMTFDNCTFNVAGKVVNVYKESGDGTYVVNLNNCTVNSSKANKAVLNIKDANLAYTVNITGTNTVTGLEPNSKTCSVLYMIEGDKAIVNIDGETVWTAGKMVTHDHSYGAENDKVTVTYGEWEPVSDWELSRPYHKTCSVCGWEEDGTETRTIGNLTVSNTVTGSAADKTKAFTFTVTLGDTTVNGTYGEMTFTNGVATFTLKGGESATATGLPGSTEYTVTESDADGYTVTKAQDTGKIFEAITAAFTNTKESSATPTPAPSSKPSGGTSKPSGSTSKPSGGSSKPSGSSSKSGSSSEMSSGEPKTGDSTPVVLWSVLFTLSLVGLASAVTVCVCKRRSRS